MNEVLEDSDSLGGAKNANGTAVTAAELAVIKGVTGVDLANEAAYQAAIGAEAAFSNLPMASEVQVIIDTVNTAATANINILNEVLEDSDSPDGSNNANGTAVTATQLAAIIGITGVNPLNELAYQALIAHVATFNNPPTVFHVQAIIGTVNVAASREALDEVLEDSRSVGGYRNENEVAVTAEQLAKIVGIIGVNLANEPLYQAVIRVRSSFSTPPKVIEVQDVIDGVNATYSDGALEEVLEDSGGLGSNNVNGTAVTAAQLASIIGITAVDPANELAYQATIRNEIGFSNPPTVLQVQNIIDFVNTVVTTNSEAALNEVLEDSDSLGGAKNANETAVTATELAAIKGITTVDPANELAYQAEIGTETNFSNPPTVLQVQHIIDFVNIVVAPNSEVALNEVLEDSRSVGGYRNANRVAVTARQLAAIIGITRVIRINERLYQFYIKNEANFSNLPTVSQVQGIIDIVNLSTNISFLSEILEDSESSGGANNANGTTVTAPELAAITGITRVKLLNESAYQAEIRAETNFSNPPTVSQVQGSIDTVNAAANIASLNEVLEDSDSPGGDKNNNTIPVTATELAVITGITDVNQVNESAYQAEIGAEKNFSNPPTVPQVQGIIDTVNAAATIASLNEVLEDSDSDGGAKNANGTAVTALELVAITGITEVDQANEQEYQAAIGAEKNFSNPPTASQIQAIIDTVNAAAGVCNCLKISIQVVG